MYSMTRKSSTSMKPIIAISSCLLGNNVRFNGSNSNNKMLGETFSDIFSYRIICPEVFAGLGIPRKPIYLQQYNQNILVLENDTSRDLTSTLDDACLTLVQKMKDVDGFILKKNSPSCGNKSVKVYNQEKNVIYNKANGRFVDTIERVIPNAVIEDEGRLNDPYLKEHFIKRVFLNAEVKSNHLNIITINDLMNFHLRHKMLMRLHNPDKQKLLGQLIAQSNHVAIEILKKKYFEIFVTIFEKVARKGHHVNILQRILREINKNINAEQRQDLQVKIKQFHDEVIPLAVPVEMIKHYLIRYRIEYLLKQSYLNLYPENLGLMSKM